MMNLSEEDLAETIAAGSSKAASRAHWATEYLAQAGAVTRPKRGFLVITNIGQQLLANHPDAVAVADIKHLPGYQAWMERSKASKKNSASGGSAVVDGSELGESSIEQLFNAIEILQEQTAEPWIERL